MCCFVMDCLKKTKQSKKNLYPVNNLHFSSCLRNFDSHAHKADYIHDVSRRAFNMAIFMAG